MTGLENATVSLIVPCLNEERTITELLEAILAQTHPAHLMDVAIADGMSTDATRERVAAFAAAHPEIAIAVIDNPGAVIPVGLNRAIAATTGAYVVRLDAHCIPAADYVERCVAALAAGTGDVVGGRWDVRTKGEGVIARSIVAAVTHRVGIGDARYRYSDEAGEVETVPFGSWRRGTLVDVGGFDEALEANQDFELNHRIRRRGGRIWFDPQIRSVYYCRESLERLGRQYRRYGQWKVRMLRRDRENLASVRPRQVAPPALVASLLALGALAPVSSTARRLLAVEVVGYVGVLAVAGLGSARDRDDPPLVVGVPAAIATLHLTWGVGFLETLVRELGQSARNRATL